MIAEHNEWFCSVMVGSTIAIVVVVTVRSDAVSPSSCFGGE